VVVTVGGPSLPRLWRLGRGGGDLIKGEENRGGEGRDRVVC
jgi:hypothetical protein